MTTLVQSIEAIALSVSATAKKHPEIMGAIVRGWRAGLAAEEPPETPELTTAECRKLAEELARATRGTLADVAAIASVLSKVHDRAVSCAETRARRLLAEARAASGALPTPQAETESSGRGRSRARSRGAARAK